MIEKHRTSRSNKISPRLADFVTVCKRATRERSITIAIQNLERLWQSWGDASFSPVDWSIMYLVVRHHANRIRGVDHGDH